MRPITYDLLRTMIRERQRVLVCRVGDTAQRWLQPIAQDGAGLLCVSSAPDASENLRLTVDDLAELRVVNADPVTVEPLVFGAELHRDQVGHNGIAEAVLLLATFELPAAFWYTTAKGQPDRRRVHLQWASRNRFGGADQDRGGQLRTFLLERTAWIRLGDDAASLPVWIGDSYERGLP